MPSCAMIVDDMKQLRWAGFAITALLGASACGSRQANAPAATGVQAVINALNAADAKPAYELMTAQSRRAISFSEFSLQWKQREQERKAQIIALQAALKLQPSLNEQATLRLTNGRMAQLQRTADRWSLQSPLIATSVANSARDAVQLFARAVTERDLVAILSTLTARRRDGLAKQVKAFIAGIESHSNDALSDDGPDRRTLRWDDGGMRFEIILRLEEDQWRIDDIVVREVPKVEEPKPETTDEDE
jgi:hypothetical protein